MRLVLAYLAARCLFGLGGGGWAGFSSRLLGWARLPPWFPRGWLGLSGWLAFVVVAGALPAWFPVSINLALYCKALHLIALPVKDG